MVEIFFQKSNNFICSSPIAGYELLEVEHINKDILKWMQRKMYRLYNFGKETHVPDHIKGLDIFNQYTAKVYVNNILSLRVDYNPITRTSNYTTYPSGKGIH